MKKLTIIIILFVFATPCFAKHLHLEKWYQDKWCEEERSGETDVVLVDGKECDCIVKINDAEFAIEFDFDSKWAESVGQSLHYGKMTDRWPGIVLILEDEKGLKNWKILNNLIQHYRLPIATWMIRQYEKE